MGDDFCKGNTYWGSYARIAPVYLQHYIMSEEIKQKVKGKISKVSYSYAPYMLVLCKLNLQLISNIVVITIVVVVGREVGQLHQ
jgi:hypothetical protein